MYKKCVWVWRSSRSRWQVKCIKKHVLFSFLSEPVNVTSISQAFRLLLFLGYSFNTAAAVRAAHITCTSTTSYNRSTSHIDTVRGRQPQPHRPHMAAVIAFHFHFGWLTLHLILIFRRLVVHILHTLLLLTSLEFKPPKNSNKRKINHPGAGQGR